MSGESVQGRDLQSSFEPLPPVTSARAMYAHADPTQTGSPLPPYRPGLYASGAAAEEQPAAPVTAWGAPLEAVDVSPAKDTAEAAAPEADEVWDAAEPAEAFPWDAGTLLAEAAAGGAADSPASALEDALESAGEPWEAEPSLSGAEELLAASDEPVDEMLLLDDAVIEPPAPEPTGIAAEEDDGPERVSNLPSVPSAWDVAAPEEEPDTLAGTASSEIGWEEPAQDRSDEIETGPDRSWWADVPEPADWSEQPAHGEADPDRTDEASVPGAASEMTEAAQWEGEPVAADAATELEPPAQAQDYDFPWDIEPPVVGTAPEAEAGATIGVPVEPDLPEDAAVAAEPPELPPVSELSQAELADDDTGERVQVLQPTPLDEWYHGRPGQEAAATWEAFGRALEEAAAWGEPRPVAETPGGEEAQPPAPSDEAMLDLARRLEALAARIRSEGERGMNRTVTEGDRLDASLAGFIAGYVAAKRD